jgi:hypothetical protein
MRILPMRPRSIQRATKRLLPHDQPSNCHHQELSQHVRASSLNVLANVLPHARYSISWARLRGGRHSKGHRILLFPNHDSCARSPATTSRQRLKQA